MIQRPHRIEIWMFLIALIIVGAGLYFFGPSITGFVIRELSYTDDLNLVITSSGNYTWNLQNIGDLKSAMIEGRVTNSGKARVYIEENGKGYLIFDSARIGESKELADVNESGNMITGFAANSNDDDEDKKKNNKKPEWEGPNEFTINGTAAINLSQYFNDKDGGNLTYSASPVENIDASISNEIITITAASGADFNTTITITASDGIDTEKETVKLIVLVKKEEPAPEENNAPVWNSSVDTFIVNGTTIIDLSQYFVDEDNDGLTYSSGLVDGITITINSAIATLIPADDYSGSASTAFTAYDGKNLTIKAVILIVPEKANASIAEPISETNQTTANLTKSISANLAYKSGSVFDANDNGEEGINGVVDLSVEGTEFNWDADSSRLCTRWEVYNAEDAKLTTFCNGNNDCCAFVGLLPTKANWSEVYYSTFGKEGAGYDNIVSAQVLYYDVNLSVDNPKSEIYYSSWSNKTVKFYDEETEFFDECIETCSLSGLNKSSYTLVFEIEDDAVLRIDRIKYSMLADVSNNPPLLLRNFSAINVQKNRNATINLSQYFSDTDGDILSYGYYKPDNITILFENGIATIVPDKGVSGERFTYIIANDSESIAVSNLFMLNISEGKFKPKVEIGKSVRWRQKILIDVKNASSVNFTLPETASNITINILDQTMQKELPNDKIKIVEGGKVKDKDAFEIGKRLSNINKKISILEEAMQKGASRVAVDEEELDFSGINSKLNELYAKRAGLEQQLGQLAPSSSLITGNVVAITETTINDTLPTLFINESLAQNIEISIEYETEAPIAIENEINAYTKQVRIVSETSYEDVLSYTALNDVPQSAIKLYWLQDNEKILFENVDYIDENSNGLIDRLEWLILHLSNQTFEISITVLNVQSYPTVGGNWTVAFNTTGTGNLTIYAYDGTSYAEVPDDSSTINDLEYLETRCNDIVLNTTIVCANGEQMPYEVYKIKKRIAEIKKRLNELNQTG